MSTTDKSDNHLSSGNKKGGEFNLRLFCFSVFQGDSMLKAVLFALIYDFLLFFVRLNKTHKRTYAMVEYIRDMKPRIIIIRLLKSIGVGIIVAAILAMISVFA